MQDIHFGYGGRTLMEGVSIHVKPGDRVALVGPNGAGKTTLLGIITGEVGGYDGNVTRRKGIRIGLLPQDGIYDSGRTVFDSAMEAFSPLTALKREMEKLNAQVESEADDARRAELLTRLGDCQNEFEAGGGFTCKADTAKVLTGLGFAEADFGRDVGALSGGWQMRVALARLLLKKPDVLLLDEPTNHLDLPAIIWFESFLHTYEGAVVLISHDRRFLDRVARRIAEFNQRRLEMYAGNYSYYEVEKEKRLELLRNAMENQQREIRQTERFIERFRYKATKARQVQSRVKALEKIDRIELPEGRKVLRFSFKPGQKSGKVVMQLMDVSKVYGDNRVLDNVNLTVNRGDRVGIIGANGLGKSTLMRVLAGRTEFEGERMPGHNVTVGYFSQDQYELLSADSTVLEEAAKAIGPAFGGNLRSLLGVFLFSGRDVEKKVGVLSGGEKSR
ncbi:MAG: ABC-F family ATP-binding cassette domain-containing protein, partial [bacterium]